MCTHVSERSVSVRVNVRLQHARKLKNFACAVPCNFSRHTQERRAEISKAHSVAMSQYNLHASLGHCDLFQHIADELGPDFTHGKHLRGMSKADISTLGVRDPPVKTVTWGVIYHFISTHCPGFKVTVEAASVFGFDKAVAQMEHQDFVLNAVDVYCEERAPQLLADPAAASSSEQWKFFSIVDRFIHLRYVAAFGLTNRGNPKFSARGT